MSLLIVDTNIMAGALFGRSIIVLNELDERGFVLLTPRHQASELIDVSEQIAARRGVPTPSTDRVLQIVSVADPEEYQSAMAPARARLQPSAQADWPLVALALVTGAPVMSRDRDLFGTGIVTWLPANIQFAEPESPA